MSQNKTARGARLHRFMLRLFVDFWGSKKLKERATIFFQTISLFKSTTTEFAEAPRRGSRPRTHSRWGGALRRRDQRRVVSTPKVSSSISGGQREKTKTGTVPQNQL